MRTPDPSLEQLRLRLTKLLPSAISFSGQGFRSTTPKYATETDLLTGEGSKRYGGRWNPPGIAVIYASLSGLMKSRGFVFGSALYQKAKSVSLLPVFSFQWTERNWRYGEHGRSVW